MPYISCRMLSCLSLQYSRAGINQRTHTLFWAKEGAKCRHNDTALHTNSLFYWSRSYQTWSVCVLYLNASRFHLSFFSLALPLPYFTGCQEWQWRHVCGVCLCVALCSSVHVCPCRSPELEQESDSISRLSRSGATERCVPFLSLRLSHTHTVTENCACSSIYSLLLSYSTHTQAFSLYLYTCTHGEQWSVEPLPSLMCKSFAFSRMAFLMLQKPIQCIL